MLKQVEAILSTIVLTSISRLLLKKINEIKN